MCFFAHKMTLLCRQKRTIGMKKTTILLAATLLLAACGEKKEEKKQAERPIPVKEMTVGRGATSEDYNYSGTVEEENGRSLSFTMGGTITMLNVKVGDHVRRGQLLATVDATSLKNNYDIAHTTRLQMEDAHARMKMLHDRGSLPEIKWVEAESQLSQAISAEKIAEKSLGDCRLVAPCDGVVAEKMAEQGQNAAPGIPVLRIVTTSALNVSVPIPEGEVANIRQGQHADIIVPALGNRHYDGRVIEKAVLADPLSRSYKVKVRLSRVDRDILSGMVTKVALGERRQSDVIVIPAHLVQLAENNQSFVWVDANGVADRRFVTLGDYTAAGVTITSGLKAGDKVITEGQQKVSSGMKVTAK